MDKNEIAKHAAAAAAKLLHDRTNGDVILMMTALNTIEAGLFTVAMNGDTSLLEKWSDTSRSSVKRLARIYCKARSTGKPHH